MNFWLQFYKEKNDTIDFNENQKFYPQLREKVSNVYNYDKIEINFKSNIYYT